MCVPGLKNDDTLFSLLFFFSSTLRYIQFFDTSCDRNEIIVYSCTSCDEKKRNKNKTLFLCSQDSLYISYSSDFCGLASRQNNITRKSLNDITCKLIIYLKVPFVNV